MPSAFPASVDTFSAKADHVTTIVAADVNNLQNAVVAIESTLRSAPSPNPLDYPSKAEAADYLSKTKDETISGRKTFSASPIVLGAGWTIDANGNLAVRSVTASGALVSPNTNTAVAGGGDYSAAVRITGGKPWFDVTHPTYGAKGDGTTDDTAAIQAAIAAAITANTTGTGAVIYFPFGYYQTSNFTLATNLQTNLGYHGLVFTGPGVIRNGTLQIGQDGVGYDYVKYDCRIEGLSFWSDTLGASNAIELRRAYNVRVVGVNFRKYNAAVAVPGISLGGSNQVGSGHITIQRCSVGDYSNGDNLECNYLFYVGANVTGGTNACNDTLIEHNNPLLCLKAAVHVEGQDGLHFTDNYANVVGASPEAVINVISPGATQVVISDNHLFPSVSLAGDVIHLANTQHAVVTDNNINPGGVAWASGHAIRLTGGGQGGSNLSVSVIADNNIFIPPGDGIHIDTNTQQVLVSGNFVRAPGAWGVNADATTDTVLAVGNLIAAPTTGTVQLLGTNSSFVDTRTGTNVFNQAVFVSGAPVSATAFKFSSDTTRFIQWGTGSPEGVVTAAIGSQYLQTDGALGTTLWLKFNGSGNTGWAPSVERDTADPLKPTSFSYESFARSKSNSAGVYTVSAAGKLVLQAVRLPINTVISNLSFFSSAALVAGGSPHVWFALFDKNLNLLAWTGDDTAPVWGSSAEKTYPITKNAGGGTIASYTITSTDMYYIGVMQNVGTPATLVGALANATVVTLAPILMGETADTGLTTTPPNPSGAITGKAFVLYGGTS